MEQVFVCSSVHIAEVRCTTRLYCQCSSRPKNNKTLWDMTTCFDSTFFKSGSSPSDPWRCVRNVTWFLKGFRILFLIFTLRKPSQSWNNLSHLYSPAFLWTRPTEDTWAQSVWSTIIRGVARCPGRGILSWATAEKVSGFFLIHNLPRSLQPAGVLSTCSTGMHTQISHKKCSLSFGFCRHLVPWRRKFMSVSEALLSGFWGLV